MEAAKAEAEYPGRLKLTLRFLSIYWKSIFLLGWPVITSPIVFCNDGGVEGVKFRCLYAMVLMAGFWVTECVPLYITGLMPVFLFPLLNVMDSGMCILGVCPLTMPLENENVDKIGQIWFLKVKSFFWAAHDAARK